MKNLLILAILLFFRVCTVAQTSDDIIRLSGKVQDYATRLDLPGCLVEILHAKDSTVIASKEATTHYRSGELKWVTGEFALDIPRETGDYILRVTKENYEPAYIDLPLHSFYKRETSRELGTVCLQQIKSVALDEVTVTATKVKFYHKGDTLVYNADAFQLAEGSMLDALIRQLPGVELRKNGQIYVNGKFVQSLLLNGKDFFRGDNRIMLDNLPIYAVSQVSIYDKLGDDSRFLGYEAANDKMFVMDVQLKKQYNIGWMANVEAGGGTKDRYLARLFAMRFTDHSRVALYGNLNNLNDSRKPGENDNWTPSDMDNGQTSQKMGGLDYYVGKRDEKYKLNGNIQVNHTDNRTINNTNRTNFLSGGDTYDRITDNSRNHSLSLSTNHRFYFDLNKANLEIKPNVNYRKYNNRNGYSSLTTSRSLSDFGKEQLDSLYSPQLGKAFLASAINRNLRNGLTNGHTLYGDVSLKSLIKFKHSPDHLTLYADASFRDASEDSYDQNHVEYYNNGQLESKDFRNRYFDNRPDKGYGFTGKVTYTYVIKRNMQINWSYQYKHKITDRSSSLYRLDRLRDWGEDSTNDLGTLPSVDVYSGVIDAANSYDSHQTDRHHTFEPFLIWGKTLKKSKWHGQLVLPVSLLSRTYHYQRGAVDTTFTKRNVLLNAYSTYAKWTSDNHKYEFQLQYSLNTKAPDMNMYVNIQDTTDPLNITMGNTDLKPSYKHEVISTFTRIYPKQRLLWTLEAIYSPTQNAIAMGYTYDKTTGRKTFRPDNINGNWKGQIALGGGGAVNKKGTLNAKAMIGVDYNHNVDLVGVTGASSSNRSVVNNLGLMEMLQLNYKMGKSVIGLKTDGTWSYVNGTREDFQSFHAADFNYGLTMQLQLPWSMQLGSDLTMYSRCGYVDKSMNSDDLVWNARLSRPFFNGRFIVMLDGFDILGQLSNITRTMNAQGITETYRNVIPRYIMLHASYRLHVKPKKK